MLNLIQLFNSFNNLKSQVNLLKQEVQINDDQNKEYQEILDVNNNLKIDNSKLVNINQQLIKDIQIELKQLERISKQKDNNIKQAFEKMYKESIIQKDQIENTVNNIKKEIKFQSSENQMLKDSIEYLNEKMHKNLMQLFSQYEQIKDNIYDDTTDQQILLIDQQNQDINSQIKQFEKQQDDLELQNQMLIVDNNKYQEELYNKDKMIQNLQNQIDKKINKKTDQRTAKKKKQTKESLKFEFQFI